MQLEFLTRFERELVLVLGEILFQVLDVLDCRVRGELGMEGIEQFRRRRRRDGLFLFFRITAGRECKTLRSW